MEEYRQRVGFLTRVKGHCGDDDCEKGDVIFNIIEVDSYSFPMQYNLYSTHYEACMNGGVRDDIMHKAVVMQVQSHRGLDVTLCCQYNDGIVFDCITSTKQDPIFFP